MSYNILYPRPNEEGVCLIMPAKNSGMSIEEIARKDTPAGVPYKIVENSSLPEDLYFLDAWEMDFSEPDGYGIGAEAWFAEKEALKNDNN